MRFALLLEFFIWIENLVRDVYVSVVLNLVPQSVATEILNHPDETLREEVHPNLKDVHLSLVRHFIGELC